LRLALRRAPLLEVLRLHRLLLLGVHGHRLALGCDGDDDGAGGEGPVGGSGHAVQAGGAVAVEADGVDDEGDEVEDAGGFGEWGLVTGWWWVTW
jgi:hypothetical protein